MLQFLFSRQFGIPRLGLPVVLPNMMYPLYSYLLVSLSLSLSLNGHGESAKIGVVFYYLFFELLLTSTRTQFI